jgi:hypothetical protein
MEDVWSVDQSGFKNFIALCKYAKAHHRYWDFSAPKTMQIVHPKNTGTETAGQSTIKTELK